MNLLETIGICTVTILGGFAIIIVSELVNKKVKDIKDSKRIIPKGTIFFSDGRRVLIKKDIEIRFNKRKYTECYSNSIPFVKGVSAGIHKSHKGYSQTEFESELLERFKNLPDEYKNILEYQDKEK